MDKPVEIEGKETLRITEGEHSHVIVADSINILAKTMGVHKVKIVNGVIYHLTKDNTVAEHKSIKLDDGVYIVYPQREYSLIDGRTIDVID